jgi:hypothetical protein
VQRKQITAISLASPSLDHLRRQARDLLRAARAGDTTAADRIRAVADALTLASAQLAVARQAEAFCQARIRDGTGRGGPDAGGHPRARPLQLRGRALDVGKLRWVSEGGCVAARRAGSSPAATLTSRKTTATSPPASSPMASQSLRAGRSRSE